MQILSKFFDIVDRANDRIGSIACFYLLALMSIQVLEVGLWCGLSLRLDSGLGRTLLGIGERVLRVSERKRLHSWFPRSPKGWL